MKVRTFAHKAIRKLFENGDAKGLPPDAVEKLRKMLAFVEAMGARANFATSRSGKRIVSLATAKARGASM